MTIAKDDLCADDLKISVAKTRRGKSSATVVVGWALTQKLADFLKQEGATDIYMLILTSDTDRTKPRDYRLVPLKDGQAYVQFHKAGINTVHATIVWSGEHSPRESIKGIGATYTWSDDKVVLDLYHWDLKGPGFEVRVDVSVPGTMFATPPVGVEKWLSDFGADKSKVDECDKRLYVGIGIAKLISVVVLTPFAIVLGIFWRLFALVAALVAALVGIRRISWKAPFTVDGLTDVFGEDPFKHALPSRWYFKKKPDARGWLTKRDFVRRNDVLVFINPLTVLFYGTLAIAAYLYGGSRSLVMVLAGALCGTLIAVAFAIASAVMESRKGSEEPIAKAVDHRFDKLVTLDDANVSGVVDLLPKPKRLTLRLLFWRAKSRVCLPYAIED